MSGPENEARARAVQEQNLLVQQLRDGGNDREADRLQETYHAREMSGLASDVYDSAKGEGEPPAGWIRASSDPEALRAAGINLGDAELQKLLRPTESGFRAEIYLPDKRVLGEDAKPVVVFKGSTGPIIDPSAPGGRRESGAEDFLNNGQQGIGMRSDYYDRAMQLAVRLKEETGGGFEIAGHSLGGGMASAASAVTGARATTFNAAGLHPETPARFGKENGLPTFDPQKTVHTYQTSGEVLNDVQNGLQRLSEEQRRGFGVLANEIGKLMQEPAMREVLGEKLRDMMPPGAQASATQFIEQLATTSGQEALRNIPVAAGKQELLLDAKTRDNANDTLIDRPDVAAPSQVAELAGPLSHALHAAGYGMRGGRIVGEQVERAGATAAHVLDRTGDGVEQVLKTQGMAIGQVVNFGSATMQVSAKAGTTVIASGRELTGQIEATAHRVQSQLHAGGASALSWISGKVGLDSVSEGLAREAERSRSDGEHRAQNATREAQSDADGIRAVGDRSAAAIGHNGQWVAGALQNGFATAGARVDSNYDLAASHVKGITSHAPAAFATVGGVSAGLTTAAAIHVPAGPLPVALNNLANLAQSARLINAYGPSFDESAARHGMADTVIPSLDAALGKQEAAARELLEQHQRLQHPNDGRQASVAAEPTPLVVGINDPAHRDFKLFQGAQAGVHALDASINRIPDLESDQLAGALACRAKQEGLESIERVVLSTDRTRVFAVDTQDLTSVNRHLAQVDVAEGRQQPLSVSTEQVAEVNRQQAQTAHGQQQVASQQVTQETQQREQEASIRRMG